jgi:hypothetical protein
LVSVGWREFEAFVFELRGGTKMISTPVVMVVFNRPDVTRQVFERVASMRPSSLFIIADGPREDKPGEKRRVAETRAIVERVTWQCELHKNYAEKNMGCMERVSTGLDWVFSIVDRAIILEDDCLAEPDFFTFCDELLERYATDTRIMAISGSNYSPDFGTSGASYFFSRYSFCWGWATWRQAWKLYDKEMKCWPAVKRQHRLYDIFGNYRAAFYWHYIMNLVFSKKINSWAYRWILTCWINSGLIIMPRHNLVKNIGFIPDATHTRKKTSFSGFPVESLTFPIRHPEMIVRNARVDKYFEDRMFSKNLSHRLRWLIRQVVGG